MKKASRRSRVSNGHVPCKTVQTRHGARRRPSISRDKSQRARTTIDTDVSQRSSRRGVSRGDQPAKSSNQERQWQDREESTRIRQFFSQCVRPELRIKAYPRLVTLFFWRRSCPYQDYSNYLYHATTFFWFASYCCRYLSRPTFRSVLNMLR